MAPNKYSHATSKGLEGPRLTGSSNLSNLPWEGGGGRTFGSPHRGLGIRGFLVAFVGDFLGLVRLEAGLECA